MKVEVPKIQILRPNKCTNEFWGERGKRGGLVGKAWAHGKQMQL